MAPFLDTRYVPWLAVVQREWPTFRDFDRPMRYRWGRCRTV
ncbi:hypothetical protein BDI4_10187 [Burkholderia diffusa]|nr:hypothetical protein BDI4_10187 [Burkholderia diffusa]